MPKREITFDAERGKAMRQAQQDHERLVDLRKRRQPMPADHEEMLHRIRVARRMGWAPGMKVDVLGNNDPPKEQTTAGDPFARNPFR